ncbi:MULTISPECIES: hypothetical protein [Streptomyces]|uniref:hypothetical protein n=1 Tax=Streptomyces TaxID=1883 RepID=UPI0003196147|nr:hypothetical protein [Streptomyces venezuelae]APE23322.1 hypothetical protein vnz_21455 [Streptomyces venezuelae]QES00700.1 hypothetical protein DEJ43_21765 [Streptomyces venezuelae ATCC 10712]
MALAVVAGVAGCQDGDGGTKAPGASATAQPSAQRTQSPEEAAQAVRAAYTKAAAAKSAKVEMRLLVADDRAPGGSTFAGVQAWGPSAADLKVYDSSYLAEIPGAPVETQVRSVGGATYVDLGTGLSAQTGGKRWLKVEAATAGGDELSLQLTGGLAAVNMDLPKELGLLAASPAVRHIGPGTRGYVEGAQGYEGELSGGKLMQVWIGADGYPLKTAVHTDTPGGGAKTSVSTTYSDFGAKAAFRTPPAEDTIAFPDLLKRLVRG